MDNGVTGRGRVLRFPGVEGAMREPITGRLLDYWESLRDGRIVPPRAAIDPHRIEALLPYTLILEYAENAPARIRLAGAHPVALMGMELRGMPAEALVVPEARREFAAHVARVFAGPETAEADLHAGAPGQMPLAARLILLPLTCDRGLVSRALGALVAERVAGTPPRRFAPLRWRMSPLAAGSAAQAAQDAGFAEQPSDFRPAPGARPHLRLVKSD